MTRKEGSDELANRIREMRRDGHSYRSISNELGVSFTTIRDIDKEDKPEEAGFASTENSGNKSPEELEVEKIRSLQIKDRRLEAYRLFGLGKSPDDVFYMTGLTPEDVNKVYRQFLEAQGLHKAEQLERRLGHDGIQRLENIDDILKHLGVKTALEAEKELFDSHEMYKNKVTLEQLNKDIAELKRTREQMRREVDELRPMLEKAKQAKEELEYIQREYPGISAIDIAREESKLILDEDYLFNKDRSANWDILRAATDAFVCALRINQHLLYLVWPEYWPIKDREVYSSTHGGAMAVPEYNETSRETLMRAALPYYHLALSSRIANKSILNNT